MKTISILSSLFLSTLLFIASCSEKEQNDNQDNYMPVQFHSGIAGTKHSKAIGQTWTAGDKVGVYMFNSGTNTLLANAQNKKYAVETNGAMNAVSNSEVIYYPTDATIYADFMAYYPYQTNMTSMVYNVDVSVQTNQEKIDLMHAINIKAKNHNRYSGSVALKFNHVLSKIEFNITPGDGLTAADINNLEIKIKGMNTKADFSLTAGTLTNITNPATINALSSANGTKSEAIILPNKIAGRKIDFVINSIGQTFTWNIPDTKAFKAGEKTIYNVTIARTTFSLNGTIVPWIDGTSGGKDIIVGN